MDEHAGELVAKARSLRSSDDAVALYREWAETYDHDVFDTLGVTGSSRIAELLAAHCQDRDAPVLDLGCGTGAVGASLRSHGFTAIDGWDISEEMLGVAARGGAYRTLRVVDLTKPFAPDNGGDNRADHAPRPGPGNTTEDATRDMAVQGSPCYGASVSAGTFTSGHVDASAVPRIVSALANHAVVAWVIADAMGESFRDELRRLGFAVVFDTLESIRADGSLESVMLVARR